MPPKGRAAFPPRHVDPAPQAIAISSDDEEEEYDLIEAMNEMTTHERRKVYALKGLFNDVKAVRSDMRAELDALRLEYHAKAQRLMEMRREIVTGARDITPEEIAKIPAAAAAAAEAPAKKKGVSVVAPSDEKANADLVAAAASPSGGIPNFWLTALANTEEIAAMITERDRPALGYLKDVTSEFINGKPSEGVVLTFVFAENPYFSNATLTKTYHMEYNEDDQSMEIGDIVGTEIEWKSKEQNLTVVVKQKKQRNKRSKEIRIVEREEKCESFFNFFTPPQPPSSDADEDEDDENDEEFYQQEVEMDIEAGQVLMEQLVHKAAFYYSGKSVEEVAQMLRGRFGFGEDDDDDEESDEEDELAEGDVDFRAMVNKNKGGGKGPQGGAAGAPQQPECKQQ